MHLDHCCYCELLHHAVLLVEIDLDASDALDVPYLAGHSHCRCLVDRCEGAFRPESAVYVGGAGTIGFDDVLVDLYHIRRHLYRVWCVAFHCMIVKCVPHHVDDLWVCIHLLGHHCGRILRDICASIFVHDLGDPYDLDGLYDLGDLYDLDDPDPVSKLVLVDTNGDDFLSFPFPDCDRRRSSSPESAAAPVESFAELRHDCPFSPSLGHSRRPCFYVFAAVPVESFAELQQYVPSSSHCVVVCLSVAKLCVAPRKSCFDYYHHCGD
mmetsp:Transcript_16009/g.37090  ORF Transcript_16009/g.37090 Transcript_16009/m.37090 type:complete len:267 (-) Transcript_16009:906-1706(-)